MLSSHRVDPKIALVAVHGTKIQTINQSPIGTTEWKIMEIY
ncbi:MAG: hypothetical protein R6W71_09920 [Bacteroidales bacterium]